MKKIPKPLKIVLFFAAIISGGYSYWTIAQNKDADESKSLSLDFSMPSGPNVVRKKGDINKADEYNQAKIEEERYKNEKIAETQKSLTGDVKATDYNSFNDQRKEFYNASIGFNWEKDEEGKTITLDQTGFKEPTSSEKGSTSIKETASLTKSATTTKTKSTKTKTSSYSPSTTGGEKDKKKTTKPSEESSNTSSQQSEGSSFNVKVYNTASTTKTYIRETSSSNAVAEETYRVAAQIYGDHNVRSGELVRFRLMDDIFVKGTRIPKNTMFTAKASFSGDRMTINIRHIEANRKLVPVSFTCYDKDMAEGIAIPYSAGKDGAGKNISKEVAQALAKNNNVAGLASRTITAAGNSINSDQKVYIRDGYEVYLVNQ